MTHLTHDIYVDAKIPRGLDDSAQVSLSLVKKLFFTFVLNLALALFFLSCSGVFTNHWFSKIITGWHKNIEHILPRMDEFIRK